MIKKNNLFELIKSLSSAEKRHFKSFAGSEKQSNYIRIFDEIDRMNEYDESVIRKKFKGERFVKQLHVVKIYLQESILKSLRNFHGSASSSLMLKDMLRNVEIYFSKELYNLCAIEIQKAEKTARQYEDDVSLLEVLNWKRKLAQHLSPGSLNVREIVDDQTASLSRLVYQNQLWKRILSNQPDETQSLPDTDRAPTLTAKVLTHHIQYRAAIEQNKNDEARKKLEELLDLLEKYPHRTEEEPSIYLSTINNLISFLVFTKDFRGAIENVLKAKIFYNRLGISRKSKSNFRLILRTYNIELEIYRDTESLGDAIKLIQEIRTMLSNHADKVPQEYLISLWFQFSYIYFLRKEFRDSLHWINQILNASFAEKRKDLYLQAHLLNLMVHLELRNFFVMRYFVAGTKRFFNRNKALKEHHKNVLSFFIKISGVPESEHREQFDRLFQALFANEAKMPPGELDYINWKKWLSEKIATGKV